MEVDAPLNGSGRPALLAVEDLTVRFGGVTALHGVSLTVGEGETVGVIGPNGAGKTTLFNAICGFVRPQTGRISWQGKAVGRIRPHQLSRLGIARTLQGVGLFGQLTVLENVIAGAARFRRRSLLSALFALPAAVREEEALAARARETLAMVGIARWAEELPGSLPFAAQKQVALARALVAAPRLLLLDEPAGGLDRGELEALAETVRALRGKVAVVLVDHNIDFVSQLCERLIVLDFGRVICAGSPAEVRADARVAEAYLGKEVAVGGDAAG